MAPRQRQVAKSEASVQAVLDAALGLFSTRGYRATSLRDIAERAGVSVGNIYHHFPNKHDIYQRLIDRYWERALDPESPLQKVYSAAEFPEDLEELAAATEAMVDENSAHILLIYLDVIEFQGEHIRTFYEGMAGRFQSVFGPRLRDRVAAGEFGDVDPMVAVMVAARWFFYFFTIEKCFGAPMHFGMTPKQAVGEFIRLLRYGLLPRDGSTASRPASIQRPGESRAKTKAAPEARPKRGGKR